ncbi:MAG: glycoside hydrolase family 5 protein [Solirubrobacteraceae bacterium]
MRARRSLAVMATVLACLALCVSSASAAPTIQVFTDQPVSSAPWLGLGVQLDPYDTLKPAQLQWPLIEQRLSFMSPGLLRVVEPEADYFAGYDAQGNPTYRWNSPKVQELQTILGYAQTHGITVVLGDWLNPLVNGDARVAAGFIGALHQRGFTVLRYYNVMNEPNNNVPACSFGCWASVMRTVAAEIHRLGYDSWLKLVGPDNENSWDDNPPAYALDRTAGLDHDNPLGGDSWVTSALRSIPSLIGAYDSHRYATIWGVENGVYGAQVRSRREEISNLDSAAKPYFAGEVGMTSLQSTPFAGDLGAGAPLKITADLARRLDPSTVIESSAAHAASSFVDSQPNIATFQYGVWMGDMMIQAINAGMSGASAWNLDDAMHVGGGYGSKGLKRWGFFNSLGGGSGYPASDANLRPWYYAWSTLSRAFPAGSQPLVLPSTGVPGLRVAAARIPRGRGYDLSFAVVNDTPGASSLTLKVPSVTGSMTLARYAYFAGAQHVDNYGLPVAGTITAVRLSAGIQVSLPASGIVVLTSRGVSAPVAPNQGAKTLADNLHGFGQLSARTKGLFLDHSAPAEFNYDSARVAVRGKRQQFVGYRASEMTSFELKAYFRQSLDLAVFVSQNGFGYWQIPLSHTGASPTVGGRQMLEEVFSALPLPAGINRLAIRIGPGTELAGVRISAARTGPACLATELAATSGELAGIKPGFNRPQVLGSIGTRSSSNRWGWQYCVNRGGQLGVVFAHRHVDVVVSTAPAYAVDGIAIGAPVTEIQTKLGVAAAGHGLVVASNGVVFVVRTGQVRAIALATPALTAHLAQLARAIRRAGVL